MDNKDNKKSQWWKDFLMTIIATTISIVLTFGTAALVDRKKEANSRRQMTMSILYDLKTSLEQIEACDSALRVGMELQIALAGDPSSLNTTKYHFSPTVRITEFNETTEKIFSSNIETFNTLDNVLFVEKVSDFYFQRHLYNDKVIGLLRHDLEEAFASWTIESALKLDYSGTIFMSSIALSHMKVTYEQCKELMGVDDDDLTAFTQSRQRQLSSQNNPDSILDAYKQEMLDNVMRLQEAQESTADGK